MKKNLFPQYPKHLQFLYLLLIWIGCFLISSGLGSFIAYLSSKSMTPLDFSYAYMYPQQIVFLIGSFAVPVIIFRKKMEDPLTELRRIPSPQVWISALLFLCTSFFFLAWVIYLNSQIHWGKLDETFRTLSDKSEQIQNYFLHRNTWSGFFWNTLVLALLPAFCEEMFFRGCIQKFLTDSMKNPHFPILLTAMIFSFFHLDASGLIARFLLGAMLGYAFYYTSSLWVPICLHFLNNFSIVLLSFLYNRQISSLSPDTLNEKPPFYTVILSILFSVAVAYWFIKATRQKKQRA